MDAKLILVKVITLLYRESQNIDKTENSSELVKQILADLKLPEAILDTDKGRDTLIALRQTALWMANNPLSHEYVLSELLQRIRVNVGNDEHLLEAIMEGFVEIEDISEIKKLSLQLNQQLKAYVKQTEVTNVFKQASHKLLFSPEEIDWNNFVGNFISQIEPFSTITDDKIDSEMDSVDFGNIESLKETLSKAQDEISSNGTMKTGIQALNRIFGDHGGFMRGESWVIGALQHNFKSGFLMTILKGLVNYNEPLMLDKKKKPLILFITLENSITQNVLWLYQSYKENETGEYCDIKNISIQEAAEYVNSKFTAKGYHVKMRRFNPTEFGYRDLFNVLLKYESEGYEIHALLIDYLNMMSKVGCVKDTIGGDVRDLFRRIRNFTNSRKTLMITPHQLSSEAKNIVRSGADGFVKEIANKGYYDSCKLIDQEVDGEIYIHIEKVKGTPYLTVQRGKHRKVKITPEEDLYFILPFQEVGAIIDDVGQRDLSMKKFISSTDDWL